MAGLSAADRLAVEMRSRIASRSWPAGGQIPGREALAAEWSASLRTVQASIKALIDEGNLVSHGGHGTRVTAAPPCRDRVVLVVPREGGPELAASLTAVAATDASLMVRPHDVLPDVAAELAVGCHRGLVLVGELDACDPTTRQQLAASGRVVSIGFLSHDVARVHLDLFASIEWALGELAAHHCRRVATLLATRPSARLRDRIAQQQQQLGLAVDTRLVIEMPIDAPHQADGLIGLLWSLPEDERPDGLLISDDHLVPAVTAAIRARLDDASLPVVLAHANHPVWSATTIPARRYGFRSVDVIGHARDLIDLAAQQPRPMRTLRPRYLD